MNKTDKMSNTDTKYYYTGYSHPFNVSTIGSFMSTKYKGGSGEVEAYKTSFERMLYYLEHSLINTQKKNRPRVRKSIKKYKNKLAKHLDDNAEYFV